MPPIKLPWPEQQLSPNSRMDPRAKIVYRQMARTIGMACAQDAGLQLPEQGELRLDLLFCPPDQRKRDADNVLASLKSYLDGIFQYARADDNRIRRIVLEWGKVEARGAVYADIYPMNDQDGRV